MKKREVLIFLGCMLLLSAWVSAEVAYHGNTLKKNYRWGETISGQVNISFMNTSADVLLKSNFPGNMSLLLFLEKNGLQEGKEYTCSSRGCTPSYQLGQIVGSASLQGEKIMGLRVVGNAIRTIEKLAFRVESDLSSSCTIPLVIDVLDDGKDIFATTSYRDIACTDAFYGCFNSSSELSLVLIKDSELCTTIQVPPAPAYRIGGKIIAGAKRDGKLKMTLRDSEGNDVSCFLSSITENEQELDCIVEALSLEENYTICIENEAYQSQDTLHYKVHSELSAPVCGSETRDFEIFIRPLQYNRAIITVNRTNFEKFSVEDLEEETFRYLKAHYPLNAEGDVICNPPCVIPMRLSGPSQTITLNNLQLIFEDGGSSLETTTFYAASLVPVTVQMPPLLLNLSPLEFVIPSGNNASFFSLSLDDQKIFQENISISESFDFEVSPLTVFLGIETNFQIYAPYTFRSSRWNFGDGSFVDVNGTLVRHRYSSPGNFSLEVTAMRNDSVVSVKTFPLHVGNPRVAVNLTLRASREQLQNISEQLKQFDPWLSEELGKLLALNASTEKLAQFEKSFLNASTDEEYMRILDAVTKLQLPTLLSVTKKGNAPLSVGFGNLDLSYLEEISGEEFPDHEEARQSIVDWYSKHYRGTASFETISALSSEGEGDKELLTSFVFDIEKISDREGKTSLFLDFPFESVRFKEQYGQESVREGAGVVVPVKMEEAQFSFLVPGEIRIEELSAYLAPPHSELLLVEKEVCEEGDPSCEAATPWIRILLWLSFLLLGMLTLYLFLQELYKRRYERHLFRSPYDLYNLINFIHHSRGSGMPDPEIKKRLKSVGWSSERIAYAFKKLDGKRTGMWEIPLFKVFERRKVQAELVQRQGRVNANFIKQTGF